MAAGGVRAADGRFRDDVVRQRGESATRRLSRCVPYTVSCARAIVWTPLPRVLTSPVSPSDETHRMSDDALRGTARSRRRASASADRLWSVTQNGRRVDAALRVHAAVGVGV